MIRVNVNGRVWELVGQIAHDMPIGNDEHIGVVVINGNEKSDYVEFTGISRGGYTVFFYGIDDEELYYSGEDPAHQSDDMVCEPPFSDAEQIVAAGGTAWWAKPLNIRLADFRAKALKRYGHVQWHDVSEEPGGIGESAARSAIDRVFLR